MTIPNANTLNIADVDLKLAFGPALEKEILSHGRLISFDRDTVVFREGESLNWALILVEGRVQLFHKNFERDRELMLYEVAPKGPSKLSCVTFYNDEAKVSMCAVAKRGCTLLYIPTKIMTNWAETSLEWNQMVIRSFREIFDALVCTLKSTGTSSLDERIKFFLTCRADAQKSDIIHMTHEQIANSVGTSRVVVSRILKEFESRGDVELSRGQIELLHHEKSEMHSIKNRG
jgi:CRP/FNR family transcriptional regulator